MIVLANASLAVTVALSGVPAATVPVEATTSRRLTAATLTVIGAVVAVRLAVTVSLAVIVWLPAVFRMTPLPKTRLPLSPARNV